MVVRRAHGVVRVRGAVLVWVVLWRVRELVLELVPVWILGLVRGHVLGRGGAAVRGDDRPAGGAGHLHDRSGLRRAARAAPALASGHDLAVAWLVGRETRPREGGAAAGQKNN